jgi:hypothetical protein
LRPPRGLFFPRPALRETLRIPRLPAKPQPIFLCGQNRSWKSPIISPNPKSKPANSRTPFSTLSHALSERGYAQIEKCQTSRYRTRLKRKSRKSRPDRKKTQKKICITLQSPCVRVWVEGEFPRDETLRRRLARRSFLSFVARPSHRLFYEA